ncbi:hypothetical protein AMIS_41910 [Actinoplanes missouriensis 431]|uniref:Uncharacterized protein n=1 Tax=Actinoplanes missouriensis (strain ATCC 14538 / DSM 43046 / CBS 188.64 / JCM 3121 / NBRC 102363 / NCIMB 12654 / NRRL B-3342 / UNCC 431) TaxID=512565 RepID=I0H8S4_ACTM4|nr:hypothetical protein [Actinoplanes missouriensis]BAL89411.1 hypothetical protein AMIS_41910 [Actinoplanes missouriensis 431]
MLGVRWVAGITGGRTGLVLVLAVLLAGAVIGARMLVGLLAYRLGGSAWALTRGRVTVTAGAFVLGGVAVPLVFAGMVPVLPPVVFAVLGAVGATVVVAVQGGILAQVYLLSRSGGAVVPDGDRLSGAARSKRYSGVDGSSGAARSSEPIAGPLDEGQAADGSADLADVDARLAALSGPPAGLLPWAGAAAAVLGLLAPAVAAAVNPFHVPAVRSHGDTTSSVAAVAWPAGGHPVIATWTGARFCDDDVCDRYTDQNGGPTVVDENGAAGIGTDGTTVVSGGRDDGGPFIHYARCTRDGCPEAWVPVRASAREAFDWPDLGAAVAPDRAVWFVLAHPGEKAYRITFLRCPAGNCEKPRRYEAGTVERLAGDDLYPAVPRVRLSVGVDGRPLATIRTGSALVSLSCDSQGCGSRGAASFISTAVSAWASPVTLRGPAVSYEPGQVRVGERPLDVPGSRLSPRSGAVVAAGSTVYVTAAEETARPGLHVTVGEQPGPESADVYWRQVLWRCDEVRCTRQALDDFGHVAGHEAMAVAADGRILIVRQDRILLVSASPST